MRKKTYKHLKKEEFTLIHQLNNLGVKQKAIADATKRSAGLVNKVLKHETFEVYKESEKAASKARRNKVADESVPVLQESTSIPVEDLVTVIWNIPRLNQSGDSSNAV